MSHRLIDYLINLVSSLVKHKGAACRRLSCTHTRTHTHTHTHTVHYEGIRTCRCVQLHFMNLMVDLDLSGFLCTHFIPPRSAVDAVQVLLLLFASSPSPFSVCVFCWEVEAERKEFGSTMRCPGSSQIFVCIQSFLLLQLLPEPHALCETAASRFWWSERIYSGLLRSCWT